MAAIGSGHAATEQKSEGDQFSSQLEQHAIWTYDLRWKTPILNRKENGTEFPQYWRTKFLELG